MLKIQCNKNDYHDNIYNDNYNHNNSKMTLFKDGTYLNILGDLSRKLPLILFLKDFHFPFFLLRVPVPEVQSSLAATINFQTHHLLT